MNEPWTVLAGDALARLRGLGDGAYQTCCTSPPYFALRDYGTGTWEGGDDPACDHKRDVDLARQFGQASTLGPNQNGRGVTGNQQHAGECRTNYRDLCGKCGARRVDLQQGLEKCPDCFAWARGAPGSCGECYVCRMTCVFREVRRVLRPDGTLWVNVASSFASGNVPGWKAKDWVNVPAFLAESLRADGWYLRSEIQLTKLSPMPESCRDRPTRATEKLYLFSVRGRYFYDAEAEKPDALQPEGEPKLTGQHAAFAVGNGQGRTTTLGTNQGPTSRNLWDYWGDASGESDDDLPPAVWPWRPEPARKGSKHYATFPLWLPLRVIRLATSAKGCCPACGAPWVRVVERKFVPQPDVKDSRALARADGGLDPSNGWNGMPRGSTSAETTGWQPSCRCQSADAVPCRVLDCFAGTGTTGVAARLLGRSFVGIELSSAYAQIARERLASAAPLDDAAWLPAAPPPPQKQGELW